MKHREFVYVGEPVPELNGREHAAFLMNMQRSILFSLEKRNLLTASQRERCLLELENVQKIPDVVKRWENSRRAWQYGNEQI